MALILIDGLLRVLLICQIYPRTLYDESGKVHHGSLLSGPSRVALVLHYCLGLAHPTNSSSKNFLFLNRTQFVPSNIGQFDP
ncbi:hypothetical protein H5410_035334 [Solanum commersonii]|uniref:Secreted protein n=1 Tax=Solanum commersonii TaxID=4109 RepID=A0A9J5Y4U0_SOLCO|nr:hypothetical protein H5410_035334 [Solanum commersonii]